MLDISVQGFTRLNRKGNDHTIRNKSLVSGKGRIPILLDQIRYWDHLISCYLSIFRDVVENFDEVGTEVPHWFQTIPEDGYLMMRKHSGSVVVENNANIGVGYGQVHMAEAVLLEAVYGWDLCHCKLVGCGQSKEVEEDDRQLQDHDPEVSF